MTALTLQISLTEWLASLIAGGGVVVSVIIGVVLLFRVTGSRPANISMALLLFVGAAAVLNELVVNLRPQDAGWAAVFPPLLFTYSLGPLLYAYIRAKLASPHHFSRWHWALPFAQAILTIGLSLAPTTAKAAYMESIYAPWYSTMEDVVFTLSFGTYLVLSYRAVIAASRSERFEWERENHNWLRRLVLGSATVLGVSVAFNLLGPVLYTLTDVDLYGYGIVVFTENVIYSALLYWMALGGLIQAVPRARKVVVPQISERQEHYNLSPRLVAAHMEGLARHMEKEQSFLDPDLTLTQLAAQLGMSDKVLSYVLNEGQAVTYSDYINGLRVEEVKRRLADPETANLTILSIGLDAGFRSKATFNRAFKKVTGKAPSAFRP